ncbi:MAG TPA: IMS domain-containing protein [Prochlorococcus sp.]
MDLPIDHFRLLGVSPSADSEAILRSLQLKLDRSPEQGFTHEALTQRAELLRLSADLLTDLPRRQAYEAALLELGRDHPGETAGIDLPSNKEVAGLLLLLEANSPHEVFHLASQGLQPLQAPALGSAREADLALLLALACRAAAAEEQEQRRYEAAASLLHDGMQLLQRMGKLPEECRNLQNDLDVLMPYRILDLVSRDLGDQASHQEGLRLLDNFVRQRGGLEGTAPSPAPGGLDQSEFENFFQQIRKFLTVQEQVDLFLRWQQAGSIDAGFLGGLALAAVGFSRRKPERLQEAKRHLESLDLPDFDPLPMLACLDLLLGDVGHAQERFLGSTDAALKDCLNSHPDDELAAFCDYCRSWLRRDVLPGYRDVDAEVVDLEAWFADRDVQAYVERLERTGTGASSLEKAFSESSLSKTFSWPSLDPDGILPLPLGGSEVTQPAADLHAEERATGIHWTERLADLPRLPRLTRPVLIGSVVIAAFVLGALGINLFGQRHRTSSSISTTTDQPQAPASPSATLQEELLKPEVFTSTDAKPLVSDKPSEAQLSGLLQAWLNNKALVLAGGKSDALPELAGGLLVQRVNQARAEDEGLGETQKIEAKISSVEVVSQTPIRIAVKAVVAYRDQRLDAAGKVIEQTPQTNLSLTYILGRDQDRWRVIDFR